MLEASTRTEKYKSYRAEIKTDEYYGISKKPAISKKAVVKQPVNEAENTQEIGFFKNYAAKSRLKTILYILFVVVVVGLLLFLLIYFGEQFLNF